MFRACVYPVRRVSLIFVLALLVVVPNGWAQDHRNATSEHGVAVSRSVEASDVGAAILEQGGNAVDAAIAIGFALAVTHPSAGNIGGGGFMLVYPGDGRDPAFVDYREKAPLASTEDMYVDGGSRKNHRWVGVPGTVAGFVLAHEQFGTLPWENLVMPAVRLAEGGFVLNSLADALNRALERSENDEFKRVYGKNGGAEAWQASDRLVLSDLGRSLRRIAEQGNDGFYAGETADLLAAEMEQGDGYISKEDLSRYAAVLRKPIRTTFRGNEIFSAPPPSSGGIALTIMLGILEHFDLKSKGRWAPQTVHLIIESMRRAYADRARHLGDSDFIEIPAHLTTKGYARELAASINLRQATMSEKLGPRLTEAEESPETTHYSVIDRSGMAVSNTYTLEQGYGSGVVVTGAGFLLNNEMGDFNRNPGVTNRQGSIGTPANLVVAEKRMLSSMTPTIAVRDGKVVLVTGSPGGRTIINTVLNVTLNVLEFGMSLRNAVDAPRLNMQWFPDRVGFQGVEDPAFADLVKQLTVMGHRVTRGGGGDANSILAKDGTFIGAADNENGGASAARR
ncbi:MAG: gamma-glutamyltransferase [Acidobacteria bacterium]|nr:gamma-glutamyltransferase [Acidobacteriota bacterium]|tara:strand:+ start:2868 stop:4562 length:1695 start_codon:yes stop_codon:yes gene_type:complete